MSTVNHQFRLAARPVGLPKRSDWTLTQEPVPEPGDDEFLVKMNWTPFVGPRVVGFKV